MKSLAVISNYMKRCGIVIWISIAIGAANFTQSSIGPNGFKQSSANIQAKNRTSANTFCDQNRQTPAATKIFQLKGLNGKATFNPAPEYPIAAKAQGITGRVIVEVLIDIQEGKVLRYRMKSGHPLLRAAVAKSVCKVKFIPAMIDGKPIFGIGNLRYDFKLP